MGKLSTGEISTKEWDKANKPKFFLLGIYPKGQNITRRECILVDLCTLQAKTVTLPCKSNGRLSITLWFNEMSQCLALEKIMYTLKDK